MTETVRILTPVAPEGQRPIVEPSPLPNLSGAVLGIIENTKPNARAVLSGLAERLRDKRHTDQVVVERKNSAAEGMTEGAYQRLRAQQSALVFAGSGD